MLVENLESRRLLAVTALHFHGALQVWGDSGNNGISVEKSGSNLLVKAYISGAYSTIYTAPDADVSIIYIQGFAGLDTISVNNNVTDKVVAYGGAGNDYIKGGGGQNELWGHGNAPSIPGSDPASDDSSADYILGGTGYNILRGQKGNDTLFSQMDGSTTDANYDIMRGDDGNDTFYVNGKGTGIAYAFGGAGNDTVRPQNTNQKAYFYGDAGYDTVDFGDFGQSVYAKINTSAFSGPRNNTAARKQVIVNNFEVIKATNFDDYLSGSDGANTLFGVGGKDKIYGNGGADLLFGGAQDDEIFGGNGNDSLFGEAGNDTLSGENDNDLVSGGNGLDAIYGGANNDTLYGDNDSDAIYGGTGSDVLTGGAGADFFNSHDGTVLNDVIYGGNQDGSGNGGGVLDVGYIDRTSAVFTDLTFGIESVSF